MISLLEHRRAHMAVALPIGRSCTLECKSWSCTLDMIFFRIRTHADPAAASFTYVEEIFTTFFGISHPDAPWDSLLPRQHVSRCSHVVCIMYARESRYSLIQVRIMFTHGSRSLMGRFHWRIKFTDEVCSHTYCVHLSTIFTYGSYLLTDHSHLRVVLTYRSYSLTDRSHLRNVLINTMIQGRV